MLRAGGYRPRAWARFLAASFECAERTRAARPALVAQLDRWLAAWLALGAAARLRPLSDALPAVPPAGELAWAAGVHAMLRWHLGMVEGVAGERRDRLSAADAATLARLWIAPRLRRADRDPRTFIALVALCAAGDVLDGALARRAGPTRLGRDLDTLADACAGAFACAAALRAGWIGRRAAAAVAARYGLGLTEALWRYFAHCQRPAGSQSALARALGGAPLIALAAGAAGRPRLATRAVASAALAAAVLEASRAAGSPRPLRSLTRSLVG